MKKIIYYVVPTLVCLAVGALSGILQHTAITEWYPTLDKPAVTPPDVAFPIAWTVIYICMGVSLGRLLSLGYRRIIWLWGAQLAVNLAWSILFFTCRSPIMGLIDIVVLDFLVALYITVTLPRSSMASLLFIPYALWLTLATYLNVYIWIYN